MARKKFKRAQQLHRLDIEANSINESHEMSNQEKNKALDRLNRRRSSTSAKSLDSNRRRRLSYVVAQKSGSLKSKSGKSNEIGGNRRQKVDLMDEEMLNCLSNIRNYMF